MIILKKITPPPLTRDSAVKRRDTKKCLKKPFLFLEDSIFYRKAFLLFFRISNTQLRISI